MKLPSDQKTGIGLAPEVRPTLGGRPISLALIRNPRVLPQPFIPQLIGRRRSHPTTAWSRYEAHPNGGRRGFRTPDLQHVKLALFQLS